MPNNSYIRSTKRERERVHYWRRKGFIACRSAGSHSAYDVWAYHPFEKLLILEQLKTKKGGRTPVIKEFKEQRDVIVRSYELHYENKRKARRRVQRNKHRTTKDHGRSGQGVPTPGPDSYDHFSQ